MDGIQRGAQASGAALNSLDRSTDHRDQRQNATKSQPDTLKPVTHYSLKLANPTSTYNTTQAPAQQDQLCGRAFEEVCQHHLDRLADRKRTAFALHIRREKTHPEYRSEKQQIAKIVLKQLVLEQLHRDTETRHHEKLDSIITKHCDEIHPFIIQGGMLDYSYKLVDPESLWPIADKYKTSDMRKREKAAKSLSVQSDQLAGIFSAFEKLTEASESCDERVEKKMLACFLAARETSDGESNLCYIDFLEAHMYEIEDMLLNNCSVFDMQMIISVWYYALSRLFKKCFLHQLEGTYGNRPKGRRGKNLVHNESRGDFQEKCIKMFEWSSRRNFHRLASIDSVSAICTILTSMYSDPKSNVKELIYQYSLASVDAATSGVDKRVAYTNYIISCDLLKDFSKFCQVSNAAAQHTLYPLLVMLWHDLGLRSNAWDSKMLLNPEGALEHLEWLGSSKGMLEKMKPEVEHHAQWLLVSSGRGEDRKQMDAPSYVILYYYLIGQQSKAEKVAGRVNLKNLTVFDALVKVSKKEYVGAIKCITGDSRTHRQLKALAAILYERAASEVGEQTAEGGEYLNAAIRELSSQSRYRKELLKPLARVQEKLGHTNECLKSLQEYKKFLQNELRIADSNQEVVVLQAQIDDLHSRVVVPKAEKKRGKSNSEDNRKKSDDKILSRRERSQKKEVEVLTDNNPVLEFSISPPLERGGYKGQQAQSDIDLLSSGIGNYSPCEDIEVSVNNDFQIPDYLAEDEVEDEMALTLRKRWPLYNALKRSGRIDYEWLVERHDELLRKYKKPVSQILLAQNKVWTLRKKASDIYAILLEAHQHSEAAYVRKIHTRQQILEILFMTIDAISKEWTQELPEVWQTDPCSILESGNLKSMLVKSSPRVAIQLASLFKTTGHVMKEDLAEDQPDEQEGKEYAHKVFGRNLNEFSDLAGKFYTCGNLIKRHARSVLRDD